MQIQPINTSRTARSNTFGHSCPYIVRKPANIRAKIIEGLSADIENTIGKPADSIAKLTKS